MATYVIGAVRFEPVNYPSRHNHIAYVRLTDGSVLSRASVIQSIYQGNRFITAHVPPGNVYVHHCPHCFAGDYITTHPDNTTTNNLDSLPTF